MTMPSVASRYITSGVSKAHSHPEQEPHHHVHDVADPDFRPRHTLAEGQQELEGWRSEYEVGEGHAAHKGHQSSRQEYQEVTPLLASQPRSYEHDDLVENNRERQMNPASRETLTEVVRSSVTSV